MNAIEESEIKQSVTGILRDKGVEGFALMYFEGDNIKVVGDLPLSKIAPFLIRAAGKKFGL